MDDAMDKALVQYGATIKAHGWAAGEPLIDQGAEQWPDFRKWAHALAIMLRANEILEERG